jgi:protein-L-isoaspartate(D-aspartate) O-methyltransferase
MLGDDREPERNAMVEYQIRARGVSDPRVLSAMREVPRHRFVPPEISRVAYDDRPLPIGEGQTISQPFIVAVMTELLEPGPEDRILEIGTGSGYQAAILSLLSGEVVSMERLAGVAARATRMFEALGVHNVKVITGDGTLGYPPHAPYNGIIITAATPDVPEALVAQLAEGGRLVAPVGDRSCQTLVRLTKRDGKVRREESIGVVFVPLIGEQGFSG